MTIHPARITPYNELMDRLRHAVAAGLVNEQADGALRLFCYSRACTYERAWSPITRLARGLIVDVVKQEVVATPFPKFHNVGEIDEAWPDLPFETFEKLDGSLIIIFHHDGRWRAATKGSFKSDQAQAAQAMLDAYSSLSLTPGFTYLAEYVAPDNRIVVRYDEPALVLLGAYDWHGAELSPERLADVDGLLFGRVAERYTYSSVSELLAVAPTLPASMEGFVLRFTNGLRLKVKGDEYRRIHALVSRVTPLAVWESMAAGDDLGAIRRELPEEFWSDFDGIRTTLYRNVSDIQREVRRVAETFANDNDKEVGLRLPELPPLVRQFIFPMRKYRDLDAHPRTRAALYRSVRPTGNRLEGYEPSYAINRVMEDAA